MNRLILLFVSVFMLFSIKPESATAQVENFLQGHLIGFGKQLKIEIQSYLGDQLASQNITVRNFSLHYSTGGGDFFKFLIEVGNRHLDSAYFYFEGGCMSLNWVRGNKFPKFSSCVKCNHCTLSKNQNFTDLRTPATLNEFFVIAGKKSFSDLDVSRFIALHRDSPVSTFILDRYIVKDQEQTDWKRINYLYKMLKPPALNNILSLRLAIKIEKFNTIGLGRIAPLFSLPDSDGQFIDLKSLRGRYVLLDFWASWCIPCRKENQFLAGLLKQFKQKNIVMVGISLDKSRVDWIKAIESDHISWIQLWDGCFINTLPAQLFNVRAIPNNFLIDPNGKIVARNLYGNSLVDFLDHKLPSFVPAKSNNPSKLNYPAKSNYPSKAIFPAEPKFPSKQF